MSDSSDSEGTLSEILTQEPTFPKAAEEALLNMNNRLRAENGDLRTRLNEAEDTEWLDRRLIKEQKAKYRSQIDELITHMQKIMSHKSVLLAVSD